MQNSMLSTLYFLVLLSSLFSLYVSAPPPHVFRLSVLLSVLLIKNTTCCCRLFFLITCCYFFMPSSSYSSSSSSSPFLPGLAACSAIQHVSVRACLRERMCACVCVLMHGGPNEFDSCHLISVMRVAVVERGVGASEES